MIGEGWYCEQLVAGREIHLQGVVFVAWHDLNVGRVRDLRIGLEQLAAFQPSAVEFKCASIDPVAFAKINQIQHRGLSHQVRLAVNVDANFAHLPTIAFVDLVHQVDDVGFRRALRLKRVGRFVILSERIKYNLFYWFINLSFISKKYRLLYAIFAG